MAAVGKHSLKPNSSSASLPLFDRTGWKRRALGEFAENMEKRAEPRDAPEEIYVVGTGQLSERKMPDG